MADIQQFNVQRDIKNSAEDLRNAYKELFDWEKEIKSKEKVRSEKIKNVKIPVTNNNINQKESRQKVDQKDNKTKADNYKPTTDEKANEFKIKGNDYVKSKEYEKAIEFYTNAIQLIDNDPVFFTNRALCHLKLNEYENCIKDCDKAIALSPDSVKAYYRRMCANEALGKYIMSLKDCRRVLELEPKDKLAKEALPRIQDKIKEKRKSDEPVWSDVNENFININTIKKTPQQQSKKPLKKIKIVDINNTPIKNKQDKNKENSRLINDSYPQEVYDKLFTNNEFSVIKPSQKNDNTSNKNKQINETKTDEIVTEKETPVEKKNLKTMKLENKEELLHNDTKINKPKVFDTPKTSAQFYAIWRESSEEEKYILLKKIDPLHLNKILGASLDYPTLSEIFEILAAFYIRDGIDVLKILTELCKHDEVKILSLFLSEQERNKFSKLVNYMKDNNNDEVQIRKIMETFKIL